MVRAMIVEAFGQDLAAADVPHAPIKEGRVRVSVHAAGVNPVDWKIRDGMMPAFERLLPFPSGTEIAGIVTEVADGTGFAVGDAVYGMIGFFGGYSEEAVVKSAQLARAPATLDMVSAAAVPMGALTAWQALDTAAIEPGQRVLVHGGTGGVGAFAVQFAALRGAEVVTTVSAGAIDRALALGAAQAIDYRAAPFETVIGPVDAVIDTMGGDVQRRSIDVLRAGGVLVTLVESAYKADAEARGSRFEAVGVQPSGEILSQVAALFDAGKLAVGIAHVFPLAQATAAQQRNRDGNTGGKLVLKVRND